MDMMTRLNSHPLRNDQPGRQYRYFGDLFGCNTRRNLKIPQSKICNLLYLSTICRSASSRIRINSNMVKVSRAVPP
jgi:hypothetical protein